MATVGVVFVWLCLGVMGLGLAFIVEDVVRHRFGWGCYRDPAQDERERAERLVREAEAMVADRAALLRAFYD